MGQRPFSSSKRRGQLDGLLAARATAEATLSSCSTHRAVPQAGKLLERTRGTKERENR